ncbi:MAG: hypothetical protein RIT27_1851 [Pseudomonadota bacterium]|jgi:4-amino-4-deoxychorismate lyase
MQLLETLKIDQGKIPFLAFHNARFNATRKALFNVKETTDLADFIYPPDLDCYRCRIIYGKNIEKIEFIPFQQRSFKTFQLVYHDYINYAFKYLDRQAIQQLVQQKQTADDILIIKQGVITDTSIANVAFFDGQNWITPQNPLLKGTARARLLNERKIIEQPILVSELKNFSKMALMNALIDFMVLDDFILIGG